MISKAISRTKSFIQYQQANYTFHFNTPIKYFHGDWYVNERIVEIPFVHRHIDIDGTGKSALEFGCTRSELALQLAALGYDVYGVDLRPYPFTHPNMKLYQGNLLDLNDQMEFDLITAISVLEHIGLGVYGETENNSDLYRISNKLIEVLKPGGKLIVTVPIGPALQDKFLRSFRYDDFILLFSQDNLRLEDERFFCRSDYKFWQHSDKKFASNFSNSKSDRGPTGVNFVGCFAWRKMKHGEQ